VPGASQNPRALRAYLCEELSRPEVAMNRRTALPALVLVILAFASSAPARAQTGSTVSPPERAPAAPPVAAPRPAVEIDRAALPLALTEPAGVERRLFRDGRVFVAGQPSEAALAKLKELGVTAVVNLRTPEEMADREEVPYDEAAAAARLGLEYVHLPIGGPEHPWRPEVVDRLAEVLERHRGPVLLHCTVAWRASYVWTAYLIRVAGLPLDAALARGRAIALTPDPLGELLGRRLELSFVDSPAPAAATP
jgi:uncharacterized protein (TIGR01244 family)